MTYVSQRTIKLLSDWRVAADEYDADHRRAKPHPYAEAVAASLEQDQLGGPTESPT